MGAQSWQYRIFSRVKWVDPFREAIFPSGQYRGSDAKRKAKWTKRTLRRFDSMFELQGVQATGDDTIFLHATEREEDRRPRTLMNPDTGTFYFRCTSNEDDGHSRLPSR